jgi:hypothetical protein
MWLTVSGRGNDIIPPAGIWKYRLRYRTFHTQMQHIVSRSRGRGTGTLLNPWFAFPSIIHIWLEQTTTWTPPGSVFGKR